MQKHRFVLAVVASLVAFSMILSQGTLVLAGTTGAITGTVVEKPANAPIASAKVTASSPSQTATTVTDASGHFGFLSLAPDSYTISIEKTGFESFSEAGVTVQSDQNASLTLSTTRALRTIGRTAARSSGSLVRGGVTSDVYSVTPAQQAAAAPLGGGNFQNQAYSAISSVPGVFVPISDSGGWGQTINLRGGDYTQTGNELDGIPINRAFDQYASSALSNLGNAEVQVYTGNQPTDAQASGLAGFVNQVIKTGTFPGFSNAEFGFGSPSFYHKFTVETGGATANRNFSYYLGFLGYNQENRWVDQFDGAGVAPLYGSLQNYTASGCNSARPTGVGCYLNGPNSSLLGGIPVGPNGYVASPAYWGLIPAIADREGVANFHIAVPHPHDGLKDDVQFLYDVSQTYNTPNASMSSWNASLGDVLNGTTTLANGTVAPNAGAFGGCPATGGTYGGAGTVACAGAVSPAFFDQYYYTGPLGTRLTTANLGQVTPSYFAGSRAGTAHIFGGPVPLGQIDTETTGFAVVKAQYQHNFSSNAYGRVYGYTNYSNRIDNGIQGDYQNYVGTFSSDYLIASHTRGVGLSFADQINPQNLLAFDAGYQYSNTSRNNNQFFGASPPVAYLVSSANPAAGCYDGTGARSSCANAAQYQLPPVVPGALQFNLVPSMGAPVLGTEGRLSCGGAPCEYLSANNGSAALFNTVNPAFTNASISDIIKPIDRLTINAALRYEDYTYNLQGTNTLGNQLLVNNYNASHCLQGFTINPRAFGTACPGGSAPTTLTADSPARFDYAHIFSPRLGLTYQLEPNTVLRASYGRFTQPPETSAVQATNIQASTPNTNFYKTFGFGSFARPVVPEVSYNTDFSLEQAFPKAGLQVKVSPFLRKTVNEFVAILVDPKTNFIANVNGLNRKTEGVELAVTKGDFARDGFAASLAYTYTYATTKFKVFPNGGSFVGTSNQAIQQYNSYTKFCATNPKSPQCSTTFNGQAAAPCYTTFNGATSTGGVAAPACGPGTVANPYWNAQPAALLDPNADYIPYNISLGAGNSGIGATSYIVPHVIAFLLNYKKGPFTITPSFQFQGGARYGSPFVAQGVLPDTCGAVLATSVTGDPRYPNGSPGPGAPYNAASCTAVSAIPNPQTGHFDGIGQFVQPNLISTNLSATYDFSKKFSVNMVAANIFNRCFGGSNVPWNVGNVGCAYNQSGTYVANVYNPGDQIQPLAAQSYTPNLGGALQSIAAGAPLPFQLYVNFRAHI